MKADFLKSIVQGSGLSLVKLAAGLVKIKVLALLLGVEGIGLLSLGLQFQATAVGLVSMSLAVGVINLGRPLWVADDWPAAGAVLGTALMLVAINTLLFLAGFALFQKVFHGTWMRSLEAHGPGSLWPLAVAAVILSFANVLWEGLSFLVDRFDIYVRTNMVASMCDALLFAGGAWLYGLKGALFASLLSGLSLFLVYTVFSARAPTTRRILAHLSVKGMWVKPLLSYSVLMIGTTATGMVCLFLARAHLTSAAGETANGHLQVVTALAAYLLPFVMTGVWGHLHPAAAASGDTTAARVELGHTVIASMRLAAAGCVAVVVASPILVPMVYTSAFLAARQYVAVYFAAELFFMFLSIVGAYMLAVSHKRAYFLGYAIYHVVLLAGVSLAASALGPWAYVLSHLAGVTLVSLLAIVHSVRVGMLDLATLKAVAALVVPAIICCGLDYSELVIEMAALSIRASWMLGTVVVIYVLHPYLQRYMKKLWLLGVP